MFRDTSRPAVLRTIDWISPYPTYEMSQYWWLEVLMAAKGPVLYSCLCAKNGQPFCYQEDIGKNARDIRKGVLNSVVAVRLI